MDQAVVTSETRRASAAEPFVVSAVVFLFAAFPLLPETRVIAVGITAVALTILAWFRRWRAVVSVGVFTTVCLLLVWFGVRFSQVWLAAGLGGYFAIAEITPWMRGSHSWLRVGSFGREVRTLALASGCLAGIVLVIWFVWVRPNLTDLLEAFLPEWSTGYLIVGGLFFSMVNAAVEEGAYRGVIMHALDSSLGSGTPSLVFQAIAFGTLHINGFPRGWLGVVLASIFGVLMGLVHRQANGMLAPWITHVFVDIVVVGIILMFAHAA